MNAKELLNVYDEYTENEKIKQGDFIDTYGINVIKSKEYFDNIFISFKPKYKDNNQNNNEHNNEDNNEHNNEVFDLIIDVSFFGTNSFIAIKSNKTELKRYKPVGLITIDNKTYLINSSYNIDDKQFYISYKEEYSKDNLLNYVIYRTVEYWKFLEHEIVYLNTSKIIITDHDYKFNIDEYEEGTCIHSKYYHGPTFYDMYMSHKQILV